ncbi:aminotransferase class V-fold PLP-dependent enzyme [soil metagenome]
MSPGGEGGALTADEVERWRERFPILARCTYLINNSLGAMPDTVPASLRQFTDAWATEGVEAWAARWLPEVRRIADLVGSLIGAPPGTTVVHQNVATLASMVLSSLPLDAGRDRVVVTDLEWPGHRYLLSGYQRRHGLHVEVVPTDGVEVDAARLAAAIDERTLFVPISQVVYRSGAITDVATVCARAREVGAVTMVDGYHAAGHMLVDVGAIGCDFYVGGSVKWLCGGPGVSYLHVRPGTAHRFVPVEVGWLGHERPFAFSDAWEPADGAMGWLGGTPSIPSVYAAREGYRIVAEVGPDRIRATSLALTARLVEGALERGASVRTPLDPERRAGAVTIDLGPETEAASRRLIDAGIIVDYRAGAGIRVGAHFFNTLQECDALLDALRA